MMAPPKGKKIRQSHHHGQVLSYFLLVFILAFLPFLVTARNLRNNEQEEKDRPKTALRIKGGSAKKASPSDSGDDLKKLPGARQISFKDWKKLKDVPDTGLYLVETPFVPRGFDQKLKEFNYTLEANGTMIDEATGEKITVFLESEVFDVERKRSKRRQLGNPYPLRQYSWDMWWIYDGGFCREYRAKTTAEAWGPLSGGHRPHTRIEYIETRVSMYGTDRDSCYDCDTEVSYRRKKFGCFWPAIPGFSGFHYAHWKDGSFWATHTWRWNN